jgi:hypothetical protein
MLLLYPFLLVETSSWQKNWWFLLQFVLRKQYFEKDIAHTVVFRSICIVMHHMAKNLRNFFVSHCITEPILALAELAELSRALPADQIA